jgi:hypothetical protein
VYFAIVTVTSLVTRPTVSLGVVGPNFTDIMPATALTAIAAVGDYIKLPIAAPSKAIPGGSSVTCRITSTGSAGALTLRPALEGYFR